MSRKDFIVIAETLRGLNLWFTDSDAARDVVRDFADRLALTNARFDRARFIDAATPAGRTLAA